MANAMRIEGTCETVLAVTEPIRPSSSGKGHVGVQISGKPIAVALPDVEREHTVNDEPAILRAGWGSEEVDGPGPSLDF